jgi:hypothetical protein
MCLYFCGNGEFGIKRVFISPKRSNILCTSTGPDKQIIWHQETGYDITGKNRKLCSPTQLNTKIWELRDTNTLHNCTRMEPYLIIMACFGRQQLCFLTINHHRCRRRIVGYVNTSKHFATDHAINTKAAIGHYL